MPDFYNPRTSIVKVNFVISPTRAVSDALCLAHCLKNGSEMTQLSRSGKRLQDTS